MDVVLQQERLLLLAVHRDEFHRKKEVAIHLFRVTGVAGGDFLELQHEVVAEGAVEAEVGILAAKEFTERADHGEHAGLAAAFLLREEVGHRLHRAGNLLRMLHQRFQMRMPAQGRGNQPQQFCAVGVERVPLEMPLARDQLQRWMNEAQVPARVAIRHLVVADKQRPLVRVNVLVHLV